jgi:energy-converting hydrogenase Eha subunit F
MQMSTLYVIPNPQGRGIVNLRALVINAINLINYRGAVINQYVHKWNGYTNGVVTQQNINSEVSIDIFEGYEVGGVFTNNPGSLSPVTFHLMGYHGWSNAYDFKINNSANDATRGFTDMIADTYYQRLASSVPLAFRSGTILVPTYPNQWGNLCFNADDGTYWNDQTADNQIVKYTFYDENGSTLYQDTNWTIKVDDGCVSFVQCYAGGVDYYVGIPANTAFYSVVLKDVNDFTCSSEFIFVIQDADCKHDPINLAWIGKRGGWNYYSFIKTNQNSIDIERTEYKKPFGDYGFLGSGLEDPGALQTNWRDPRQYVSRENMVTKYLTITSDWITEKEFEYLESLMVADIVHWVPDNQNEYIPMIITDNSYIMRRERNSTKYNLTLKLKYAQDYQAINYNTYIP